MPYNGTGTFQQLPPPTFPAVGGTTISSSYYNAVIADLIAGLTNAVTKDGQSGDVSFGGSRITQLGDPTDPTDAVNLRILASTAVVTSGDALIGKKRHFSWAPGSTIDGWIEQQVFNVVDDGQVVADGATDCYTALNNVLTNAPSGMVLDFGDARNIFICSEELEIAATGKVIKYIGSATIRYTGGLNPDSVMTITDAVSVDVGELYFDANNTAKNGLSVECSAAITDGIRFNKTRGGGTLTDDITLGTAVIRVLDLGGAAGTHRPKNITARSIHTYTCGSHGFLPAYCDTVSITGTSIFENAHNHGWEAVRCTNVKASGWHSEACGLSAGGVGDFTNNFDIYNFTANACAGDGAFTVEHNCRNGTIHHGRLTNCYTAAINVSHGTPETGYENVYNVKIHNITATQHSSVTDKPGANIYGSTGSGLMESVEIYDCIFEGFNRGCDYAYGVNGRCEVGLKTPSGTGTYLVKATLIDNVDLGGFCRDTVLDHAVQVLSYVGTPSKNCKINVECSQVGATSEKAVVYIDGADDGFVVTAKTNSAANYLYTSAGAGAVLCNSVGNLTGTPWAGVCTPRASYGNENSSMDFAVVGNVRYFSAVNSAGTPDFTNTIPPNTTPYFASGDRAIPRTYAAGTPREWAYGASWHSQGNFV